MSAQGNSMNTMFISILQKLIAEQGKEALLNPAKCKAFLADYTRGDFKKESRLLLQALDAGVQKAIVNAEELDTCKQQQTSVLREEHFLAVEVAADVVDTLALVLRGDVSKTQAKQPETKTQQTPSPTSATPSPSPTPATQTTPSLPTVPPEKNKTARNVAIVVVVVSVLIGSIYALSNSRQSSSPVAASSNTTRQNFKAFIFESMPDEIYNDLDNLITESTDEIRRDPNEIYAYRNRGTAYLLKKQYDMAIRDFDAAIRLDPNDDLFHASRGLAYLMNDQDEMAMRDFNEAIRLEPNTTNAYLFRGFVYLMNDQNDKAMNDIDKAISLDPNNAAFYTLRGMAYRLLGQKNRAIQDLREIRGN